MYAQKILIFPNGMETIDLLQYSVQEAFSGFKKHQLVSITIYLK